MEAQHQRTPITDVGQETKYVTQDSVIEGFADGPVFRDGRFMLVENLPLWLVKKTLDFLMLSVWHMPPITVPNNVKYQVMVNLKYNGFCWRGGFSYDKALELGKQFLKLNFCENVRALVAGDCTDQAQKINLELGDFKLSEEGIQQNRYPKFSHTKWIDGSPSTTHNEYAADTLAVMWKCFMNTIETGEVKKIDSEKHTEPFVFCDNFVWKPADDGLSGKKFVQEVYLALIQHSLCYMVHVGKEKEATTKPHWVNYL
jgi:hypothetical protein